MVPKGYSIVMVNHAIYDEAIEFLYRPRHFIAGSISMANEWLSEISTCRQWVTRLTIKNSGHSLTRKCYTHLCDATRLRYLKITLPATIKGTLAEHLDRHWTDLSIYLLSGGADLAKSLRRLDAVRFDIGPSMKGVLGDDGQRLKEMTAERQEWCKARLSAKLRKHFGVTRARVMAGPARDIPSGREVTELD